jgi:EmrB/QacA subfamily drug resistance transporter
VSDTEPSGGARMSSGVGRWIVLATVLGSGMAAIDATVVGIALPSIGRQFHAPFNVLQWVVTGYALALASLLLVGGALGDRYGRRRVFVIGIVWFTLASAACALSVNPTMLVATRVLQGIGAALLTPGSLAIIQASFDPRDRARAIGAWSGLGGVATAAGPLLGGYLIAAASWRWIFVINVPLGAAVLWLTSRHVPESRDPAAAGRVDVPGAIAAVLALSGIVFGLIDGPSLGWSSPLVVGALVAGGVSAVALVVVERRSAAPMLPMAFFSVRQFTVTNTVTLFVYGGLGGLLFLLPTELQIVDHYTPLQSGASLLPLTLLMLALSARSGRLAGAIGPRLQMAVGPIVVGAGLVLLARTTSDSSYVTGVLPGVTVLGLGLATTVAPLTATAMAAIPVEHSGIASAFNNDVARLGGLLAVAVLPAAAGITGHSYLEPAQFAIGFRTSIDVAAACCALGGLLAAVGISNAAATGTRPPRAHVGEHAFHCGLDATPLATAHAFEP